MSISFKRERFFFREEHGDRAPPSDWLLVFSDQQEPAIALGKLVFAVWLNRAMMLFRFHGGTFSNLVHVLGRSNIHVGV